MFNVGDPVRVRHWDRTLSGRILGTVRDTDGKTLFVVRLVSNDVIEDNRGGYVQVIGVNERDLRVPEVA